MTIERFKPDILLEVWGDAKDRVSPKCEAFLMRLGYSFYHFDDDGALIEVEGLRLRYATVLCRHQKGDAARDTQTARSKLPRPSKVASMAIDQ